MAQAGPRRGRISRQGMEMHSTDDERGISPRRVLRRGLLAGLGVGALLKLTGAGKAEALDPNDVTLNIDNTGTARTRIVGNVPAPNFLFGLRQDDPTNTALFVTTQFGMTMAHGPAITAQGGGLNPMVPAGSVGGPGIQATGGSNAQSGTTGGVGVLALGGTTNGTVGSVAGGGLTAIGGSGGMNGTPGIGILATGGGPAGAQATGIVAQANSGPNPAIRASNANIGPGVKGESLGYGVWGASEGAAGVLGTSVGAIAVQGASNANGVGGQFSSVHALGASGTSTNFVGILGLSTNNIGMYAQTSAAGQPAMYAENAGGGQAARFVGSVLVQGNFLVTGAKNALVPLPDGSHATVYCQESPEPYFEDFGRGQLSGGVAQVQLDRDFASIVQLANYHVFIVPEGECKGLFVSRRDNGGFEVRELQAGRSNLAFSYRVVARRKDVPGPRLARVDARAVAQLHDSQKPKAPKVDLAPDAFAPQQHRPIVMPDIRPEPGGPGSTKRIQ
jgi:hypothetical protein